MISSPVTRLNIPVTHLLKLWMGKTGISGYRSQDAGLVGHEFTKIDKLNKRINIITNVVLPYRWGVAVFCTRSISDSIELKRET